MTNLRELLAYEHIEHVSDGEFAAIMKNALPGLLDKVERYEAALLHCRSLLGAFAVDAMQEDFGPLKDWAKAVKIEFQDGAPILAEINVEGAGHAE